MLSVVINLVLNFICFFLSAPRREECSFSTAGERVGKEKKKTERGEGRAVRRIFKGDPCSSGFVDGRLGYHVGMHEGNVLFYLVVRRL